MTRDDLLKLLGGYATGMLTAEEKNLLFTAALDDQELFDALADEQALKEMLEDPECRARLLAATAAESGRLHVVPLPVGAPKKVRPRWIVPLSIAASLIVIASVAEIYLHRPAPTEMASVRTPERLDAPEPVSPPVLAPAPVLRPPPAKDLRRRASDAKKAERASQPLNAPRQEVAQPQTAEPQQAAKAELMEKKVAPVPAGEAAAVARSAGAAGAAVSVGTLRGGVVGGVPSALSGSIGGLAPAAPPAPFTQVAASPDGQLVLRYAVLKRTAGGEYSPVDPQTEFTAGDEIRLRFQANQPGSISVAESGTILFASSIASTAAVTSSTLPLDAGKQLEISFTRVVPRSVMAFSAAKQKAGPTHDETLQAKDQLTVSNPLSLRITLPLRVTSK
jgi:hypothetical protein